MTHDGRSRGARSHAALPTGAGAPALRLDGRPLDGRPLDPDPVALVRAFALKDVPRTGWRLAGVQDGESVASHAWGTAMLCMTYAEAADVDPLQSIEMALVHDVAEAEIGDLPQPLDPARRPVTAEEKARLERSGFRAVASTWPAGAPLDRLTDRWTAYETRHGPVAAFVRDMNLLDTCLEAYRYAADGRGATHEALAEFFVTALARCTTDVGRAAIVQVQQAFRRLAQAPPLDHGPLDHGPVAQGPGAQGPGDHGGVDRHTHDDVRDDAPEPDEGDDAPASSNDERT